MVCLDYLRPVTLSLFMPLRFVVLLITVQKENILFRMEALVKPARKGAMQHLQAMSVYYVTEDTARMAKK